MFFSPTQRKPNQLFPREKDMKLMMREVDTKEIMPFRETLITMSSILWIHISHEVLQQRKKMFSTKTDAGYSKHDD